MNLEDWILTEPCKPYRICDECGKLMQDGFCDMDGTLHICNDCFPNYMNKTYGKDMWKETEDDGCEGYYEYLENEAWHGTGIFWTEWE